MDVPPAHVPLKAVPAKRESRALQGLAAPLQTIRGASRMSPPLEEGKLWLKNR